MYENGEEMLQKSVVPLLLSAGLWAVIIFALVKYF